MAFGRKKNKKNELGNEKSEIAIKYNFRVSKPYGYYPEDVDKNIKGLEKQIENLMAENSKLSKQNEKLTEDFNTIKNEFSKLRFETMSFSSQTTDLQDYERLAKLSNINSDVGQVPEIEPVKPETNLAIDIIEDPQDTFDDLISTPFKVKEKPVKIEKVNRDLTDGILNNDGTLDII